MRTKSLVASLFAGFTLFCVAGSAHAQLTVSSGSTDGVTCTSGVCTTTKAKATLNVTQLETMLASSNATLKPGALSQDIVIAAGLFWSKGSMLTFDSYRSIAINSPIQVTGSGFLTMTTNDGGTGGTITYDPKANITFLSLSSQLVINNIVYTLKNSIASIASALAINSAANLALANSYDAKQDGIYTKSPIPTTVRATIDGLNNTISNLTINAPASETRVGLFTNVTYVGGIQNLILSKVNVKAAGSGSTVAVGGLVAYVDGDSGFIINDAVDGTVSAPKATGGVGGLLGFSGAVVDHCRSAAKVSGGEAGGLIGFSFVGTITNSTASGAVKVSGVAEYPDGGGLVGSSQSGTISLSSATGSVKGKHGNIGGLIGDNFDGEIDRSFATGNVKSSANGSRVGGLAGDSDGPITQSYATGSVSGSGDESEVGGLLGGNDDAVSQSYSTGAVKAAKEAYGGGFIGYDFPDRQRKSTLTFDYWDTTTSGIADGSQGAGNIKNDKGITGLSDSALKGGLPSGFDSNVWTHDSKINNGLPYLIDNPPSK